MRIIVKLSDDSFVDLGAIILYEPPSGGEEGIIFLTSGKSKQLLQADSDKIVAFLENPVTFSKNVLSALGLVGLGALGWYLAGDSLQHLVQLALGM